MNGLKAAHLALHCCLVAHQKSGVVGVLLQDVSTKRLAGLEGLVAPFDLAYQHLRLFLYTNVLLVVCHDSV